MICAVRAYGALCAECGEDGKRYSESASPGVAPWGMLESATSLVAGAAPKRTATVFIAMFGADGLKADKDGRWKTAADRLHMRAADVKGYLLAGSDERALHAALSLHACKQAREGGVLLAHAVDGACQACLQQCPQMLAALKPASQNKGGRPAKKTVSRKTGACPSCVICYLPVPALCTLVPVIVHVPIHTFL